VYPEARWSPLSPAQAGFRHPEFGQEVARCRPTPSTFWGEQHAAEDVAGVLTRGGYLVQTWGRWEDHCYQTASVGKAFTLALLGLASEKLGLDPDEPVWHTWTGSGQLSHPHKHMDNGRHHRITWRHLAAHEAGFAIESAYHWRRREIPAEPWIQANWTGDVLYDMCALRPPGQRYYSSANYVRLGQALTALWEADLKQVLDRELFGRMGIAADRWRWLSLAEVRGMRGLYPAAPGYAEYADPPFEIGGHPVRGGPGWVCMTAADLARFGLLVACGGQWRGERLLGGEWLISKSGGNCSTVVGDRTTFVAGARVATAGLPDFLWVPDFCEYRFPAALLAAGITPGPGSQSAGKAEDGSGFACLASAGGQRLNP
jgi:CubicO group peptidase (beta-lactamase class C family)